MPVITRANFKLIEEFLFSYSGDIRSMEQALANYFGIPMITSASIIKNHIVRKTKSNHYGVCKFFDRLLQMYLDEVKLGKPEGIIIRIALTLSYPPALVAKVILEQYMRTQSKECSKDGNDEQSQSSLSNIDENSCAKGNKNKSGVATYLKDTTLIPDPQLSREVFLSSLYDNQYGFIPETIRRYIGEEYELKLENYAKSAGLSFWREDVLRQKGYDKTPDILLTIPIAVDGFIVNWIESKAVFGDPYVHRDYIKDQYLSYWNRFGPGLVIYWFGYVHPCTDLEETKFIIRSSFPENITTMGPNYLTNERREVVTQ